MNFGLKTVFSSVWLAPFLVFVFLCSFYCDINVVLFNDVFFPILNSLSLTIQLSGFF